MICIGLREDIHNEKGRLIAFFLFVLLIGTGLGYFTKPAANNITLGLDLQGGFEVLYDVQPVKKVTKSQKTFWSAQ